MKYISTRGGTDSLSFSETVMTGLARDGGLLLPASIPNLSGTLTALRGLSYVELAFAVMRPYVDLPDDVLRRLIRCSYATFRDPEITPIRSFGDTHILELFHGPTPPFTA